MGDSGWNYHFNLFLKSRREDGRLPHVVCVNIILHVLYGFLCWLWTVIRGSLNFYQKVPIGPTGRRGACISSQRLEEREDVSIVRKKSIFMYTPRVMSIGIDPERVSSCVDDLLDDRG